MRTVLLLFITMMCLTNCGRQTNSSEKPEGRSYTGVVIGKTMSYSFFGDQCMIMIQTRDNKQVELRTYTPSYIGERVNAIVEKGDSITVSNIYKRNLFGEEDLKVWN